MTRQPDYQALFRASPYPYLLMDLALNIIGANDAYLHATGRRAEELLGRYVFDAFPENPDDPGSTNIAEVRSSLERAIASGKPDSTAFLRYSVPAAGGGFEERFWSTVHTPVNGADGEVAFVAQNAIDVTELYRFDRQSHLASVDPDTRPVVAEDHFNQARMHQAMNRILMVERGHLRDLFNQAPGFIAVLAGEQHVFEMVNEAYYQLVGHRELVGKPVWEALPDVRGQGYEQLLDQVYRSGKPFVGRNLRVAVQRLAHGPVTHSHVDLLYQPLFDKDGRVSGIFVQGHDVSEAHAAQLASADSAERLSEGMNAARMVVWDWHIDTREMVFSENAELVLGKREADIDTLTGSIHPDDAQRMHAARVRAIADRSGYQEIVRFRRPDDGRMLWLDIRGKVRCDADGKPFAVRGVTLDISERMRAEEDLRDAHRRKDEFLAMLSHELRNPLAPISSAAQLLKHVRLDDARLRATSDIIIRQTAHITGLVDDLIDVSRVTRGLISTDRQPHDMKRMIGDAVEQVRPLIEARRHRLAVMQPAQPAYVMGDHKRLVQVLTNLLNNAAKYTPDGGNIVLTLALAGAHVEISVRDDGIGMGADLLPRVFELFTQGERSADRAQGGLGVGLAVVRSLVELHGGQVDAASAGAGKGSELTVRLPLLAGHAPPDAPLAARAGLPQRPLRVLVVDDNPDAALMLSMLLEASGYDVLTENGSHAGLASAARHQPDVCILDIGLPEMDGYQLARAIRALDGLRGATLIAVTGYGQEQDRRLALAAGFDHHLVKPVDSAELAALLLARAARPGA
ncbi:ATP-binding protein [Massilia sp. CCM 8734]|uniref:PAS domain-containing hybrid sensor histidine kinase/response regulator n=1 Tax=Massilia sp. CCM 8734 TaxID=2609283 RepID=UPI00141EE0BC|nr:ATP-binding protein [Massilia sp. CCM 8734]